VSGPVADVDEVELLGGPGGVYGHRTVPGEGATAGVLVCPPVPTGSQDEVAAGRLGWRLTAAGLAAQRFRYRGTSPADPEARAITFAGLVADARAALEALRAATGVERVGLIGMQLGALVAARLARSEPAAPLVLWEPVTDGRQALVAAMRASPGPAGGRPGRGAGLLGLPVATELFEGGAVGTVGDEIGRHPRPLLLAGASAPRTGDEGLPEWARGHRLAVAVARTATADAGAVEGEIARWLASHLPAAPLP
jgi:alpha/beta superfamily hydrolase